jgi:hypothetical protein
MLLSAARNQLSTVTLCYQTASESKSHFFHTCQLSSHSISRMLRANLQ